MKKLKTLELFAGIAGFKLGLDATGGFETAAFCEIDPACQEVLRKHYPDTHIFDDITNIHYRECIGTYEDLTKEYSALCTANMSQIIPAEIDVITASWPCQGHSTAGKKRGLEDERSGLWKEVKRLLQETQPRWFIGENSANLRSNGLTEVLQDLWEVGYRDIRWDVLPAGSYGAIHKRERIFIIANRDGIRLSEPTFAPQKEEQIRRSEAWTAFSSGSCPKPSLRGVDDGLPKELERIRKRQVKQSGNALWPPIVTAIGKYILELEAVND